MVYLKLEKYLLIHKQSDFEYKENSRKSLKMTTLRNWVMGTWQPMILFICVFLTVPIMQCLAGFLFCFIAVVVVRVKSDLVSFLYKNTSTHNVPPTVNMT